MNGVSGMLMSADYIIDLSSSSFSNVLSDEKINDIKAGKIVQLITTGQITGNECTSLSRRTGLQLLAIEHGAGQMVYYFQKPRGL
jgi:TusA-related sulfurtransferase